MNKLQNKALIKKEKISIVYFIVPNVIPRGSHTKRDMAMRDIRWGGGGKKRERPETYFTTN